MLNEFGSLSKILYDYKDSTKEIYKLKHQSEMQKDDHEYKWKEKLAELQTQKELQQQKLKVETRNKWIGIISTAISGSGFIALVLKELL
jgi:hypothetical protein